MAFNSLIFILFFLPAALAAYYFSVRFLPNGARLLVLIVVGLAFYGRSQLHYVPLLLGTAVFNYVCALVISRSQGHARALALGAGIVVDIGLLLYFKYFEAVFDTLRAALGGSGDVLDIVMPLAISFYTFQQVAFLLDVTRGRTAIGAPLDYLAFITFFPQLLAGPISLHQEVAPQLANKPASGRGLENIWIGLALFAIGLFKKTVISDSLVLWANPTFDAAAGGALPGLLPSWAAALTYTLQLYFDFSGYSDMAIGVARMFGVVLPLNFFSPFRSRSIAELWQRWHMTLGRWVRVYIFQPMAVPLARYAANRELGKWPTHGIGVLLPLFVSMLVIGTWHGPNWTYVLFGAMHGTFMCINEAYNFATRKARRKVPDSAMMLRLYTALTVLAFVLAEVPFRSADVPTAMRIFGGMIGLNGWGVDDGSWLTLDGVTNALLIVVSFAVIYLLPNTEQLMTHFKPALDWAKWGKADRPKLSYEIRFTPLWLLFVGAALFFGMAFISRGTPAFIYFDF